MNELATLLVDAKVLSTAQLAELTAREVQEGEAAISSEFFGLALENEHALCAHLAAVHGHPSVVLSESVIDTRALGLVPKIIATQNAILPLAVDDDTLTVAARTPTPGPIVDQLQFASGRMVLLVLAVPRVLEGALAAAYQAFDRRDPVLAGNRATSQTPYLEIVREVPEGLHDAQVAFAGELADSGYADTVLDVPLAPDKETAPVSATAVARIALQKMPVVRAKKEVRNTPSGESLHIAVDAAIRPDSELLQTPVGGTPSLWRKHAKSPEPAIVELEAVVDEDALASPGPAVVGRAEPPVEVASSDSNEKKTPDPEIVVAEDDEAIATLISRALTHDGYRVEVARTGDDAVQLLRSCRPRLILLDAMLPGVHGFEICSRVKRSEAFRGVRVVMISAVYRGWEQARDIQEVHGADAFIEKPFDVHYLRKLVAGLMGVELSRSPLATDVAAQVRRAREQFDEAYLYGEWERADEAVQSWMQIDPFDGEAYLECGNLRAQMGDLPTALNAYEVAVVYSPKSFTAQTNLAMVYERLGFVRRAVQTWRVARELAPDSGAVAHIDARLTALNMPRPTA